MDETALIALGILMEEMAKETLGETGDLALVEAAKPEEEETDEILLQQEKRSEARRGRYSTPDDIDSDDEFPRDSEEEDDSD